MISQEADVKGHDKMTGDAPCQASIVGTYGCINAQSETDMTEDLKKVDVPTLIVHGEEGQLVPIADTAMLTAKITRKSTLKIYPGAPHGLTATFGDKVKQDLLSFLKAKFVRRLPGYVLHR